MSQPEVFGPNARDPLAVPLTSTDQLLEVFHQSERKKADCLIGIEYEMFGQINNGLHPIPYEGPLSITSYFSYLLESSKRGHDPFTAILEGEHIVGLTGKRAVIALEPGGQIEIAARPHGSLLDATSTFAELVKDLVQAATHLGIDLFAVGIHPNAHRDDMATVKKARYDIMKRHMHSLSGLGLDMMTRSCAIQINLDYENEQDMINKTRLSAMLVPFYSLLCTSSAFIDKKPATHAVERGNVWRKTDPARTGIPAIVFDASFGYEAWINFVLDVPMYFVRRGQVYHDARDASFRTFIAEGIGIHRASVRDFFDHMSTVFTEIRLKPILELRSADSLPVPYVNALTALSWALLYNDTARQKAWHLFGDSSHAEIVALHNDVIDQGRTAQFRSKPVYFWAEELLRIASAALSEEKLAHLLNPLQNLVAQNITCTEWILAHFQPLNQDNLHKLIQSFAPLNNPLP